MTYLQHLARAPMHWRYGREDRFPVCCIVRFIISPSRKQARLRGIRYTKRGVYFVPCLVIHRRHRTVEQHWREA